MKYKVQKQKYIPFPRTSRYTGKWYYKKRGTTKRPQRKRSSL